MTKKKFHGSRKRKDVRVQEEGNVDHRGALHYACRQ
jgi:hypothetical protein